jgi:exosome complex component RRP4
MNPQAQQESQRAPERHLVIPGDVIAEGPNLRTGPGTYLRDGKLYAARLGLAEERQGVWGIIPLSGVYQPRTGDVVIAIITEVGPSNWLTDINAPYPAPLHSSETPWKIEFGETSEYLKAGDTVLAKILFVDETKKTQITMKEPNLKKLEGGQVIEIQPSKVARVIGRQGSMIQLIKRFTDVWMVVGQNGRVWLNGEVPMIRVAVDTIRLIEEEAHRSGLTDKVTAFLKEATGRTGNEPQPAGRGTPEDI